jgi:preprotein translocase subunit SecB
MSPEVFETGYVLEALYFPIQSLTVEPGDASDEVEWGWDWRWSDHDHFEVGFLFSAPASATRPERLQVTANAVFQIVGETQTVPIDAFAHGHAPALMFPYIRQVVDELTSRSPYGRVLLPPTNIVAVMSSFDPSEATGTKTRRPDPA